MLAGQHRGETGREEYFSAFWADGPAQPVASSRSGLRIRLRNGSDGRSRRARRDAGRLLMKKKVLVVDIGGTHVKLLMSQRVERAFDSGPDMAPREFVGKFKENVRGWKFDVVSVGFPAPVRRGRLVRNPKHLGKGWVHFNFATALGLPVHVLNDAAMQALGSYLGHGRMLFLGLGTGLGSALVWNKTLMPLELGDLPYPHGHIIENYLGIPGLDSLGEKKWKREVLFAVVQLKKSFIADYVVLGGGLVHHFRQLPKGIKRGRNENAFLGGIRLWETKRYSRELKWGVL
jgi:ROK family